MNFEIELQCQICKLPYDSNLNCPRLIPECGHTFCQACINLQLEKNMNKHFQCPDDQIKFTVFSGINSFPKNFALLKVVQKQKTNPIRSSSTTSELKDKNENSAKIVKKTNYLHDGFSTITSSTCREHEKMNDIICLTDYQFICSNCAIFGDHKGHEFLSFEDGIKSVSQNASLLKELVSKIDQSCEFLPNQEFFGIQKKKYFSEKLNHVLTAYDSFYEKQIEDLKKQIEKERSKIQEMVIKKIEEVICGFIEQSEYFQESIKKWLEKSKDTLNNYSNANEQQNLLHCLIRSKNSLIKPNLIDKGGKILTKLEFMRDFFKQNVKETLSNMEFEFQDYAGLSCITMISLKNENVMVQKFNSFNEAWAKNKKNFLNDNIPISLNKNIMNEDSPINCFKISFGKLEKIEGSEDIVYQLQKNLTKFQDEKLHEDELLSFDSLNNTIKNIEIKAISPFVNDSKIDQNSKIKSPQKTPSRPLSSNHKKTNIIPSKKLKKKSIDARVKTPNESPIKQVDFEGELKVCEKFESIDFSLINLSENSKKLLKKKHLFTLNARNLKSLELIANDLIETLDMTNAGTKQKIQSQFYLELGDAGMCVLGKLLISNQKLINLKLVKNSITDDGVSILFIMIQANKTLQTLNLSLNLLTDKSLDYLQQLLCKNTALHFIYFNQNYLSAKQFNLKQKEFKNLYPSLYIQRQNWHKLICQIDLLAPQLQNNFIKNQIILPKKQINYILWGSQIKNFCFGNHMMNQ